MVIPKVFISYSHDSQNHKKWILDFATRLRQNGIDAIIDQWELKPGDDLPSFMERNLKDADFTLMICTDKYVEKANEGSGGVGYEKMIITSELLSNIDNNKIIPIIKQYGTHSVPTFLKTKKYIDFSKDKSYEYSFDDLLRTLHQSPLFKKPDIGNNPFQSVEEKRPNKIGDSISKLIEKIVLRFEQQTWDFARYSEIVKDMNISRVYLDLIISDAVEQGLITKDLNKNMYLTDKGKKYAIKNKFVEI